MQPGNNYRGAASAVIGGYYQVTQADADALSSRFDGEQQKYVPNGRFAAYKCPAVWSKMLTVWRKLWI